MLCHGADTMGTPTYTLKMLRWVKKGQTKRLGCFDPAFGRGVKSRGQNVKVLPYVYSTHELSS